MIRYFDITCYDNYVLELSYNGLKENWKNKDELINSNLKVRLLKRSSDYDEDAPYIETWNLNFGDISIPSGAWNGQKLGQISNEFIYICLSNSIVKMNKSNARKVWTRTFGNTGINNILMLDEEDGIYVQYDYYKFESDIVKSNFLKIDKNGEIIWSLDLRKRKDVVTGFIIKNNILFVFTWNCFKMLIDKNNGNILEAIFTK